MPRYEEEYSRGSTRRGEEQRPREDRHRSDRGEGRERRVVEERLDRTDSRIDPRAERMDYSDNRMPTRVDARQPNASARLEPRPDRGMDPTGRRREEPQLFKDPRTGQVYTAAPDPYQEPVGRGTYPVDDRMVTRDDPPPRRRGEVVEDTDMRDYDDDYGRGNKYNDYFVESTGIDREVIQHEICRYLGNDATVRPYTNKDGRRGYLVRAYRALTSAMIEDLRRDSARWRQEQDRRNRQGRSTGSYADMKGREESRYNNEPMDVDMDDNYQPAARRRGEPPMIDPREADVRGAVPGGRHAMNPPISTGYPPEPAYSLASNQQGNYGPESLPRSYSGGNTPPTSGRTVAPGYGQQQFSGRATAPPATVPAPAAYRDPRTGQMVTEYAGGYPPERGGRHR